jgi:hypothetical protein
MSILVDQFHNHQYRFLNHLIRPWLNRHHQAVDGVIIPISVGAFSQEPA